MSLETHIRDAFHDLADSAPPTTGMAAGVLRARRRQRRRRAGSSAVALIALAAVVAVPTAHVWQSAHRTQASTPGSAAASILVVKPKSWAPLPLTHAHTGNTTVSAHPSESPPVHLVAANDVAVSAYNFQTTKHAKDTYTWYLYNQTSGTYQKTPWAQLDVSPGLGLAAVLEGPAATTRIGIVDLRTGLVIRWIPLTKPVGQVAFAPDGTRLVATTFAHDPRTAGGDRNGFVVVDLTNGDQTYGRFTSDPTFGYPYDGAMWTYNGDFFYFPDTSSDQGPAFFHPDGTRASAPANADDLTLGGGVKLATISPDGTKAHEWGASNHSKPQTLIRDLGTGKEWTQPVEELEAWANNSTLIADGCGPSCPNENHNRLVLVSLDGTSITPLTGFVAGHSDLSPGQWRVLITRR